MNKNYSLLCLTAAIGSLILLSPAFAGTQPKFSLVPTTATSFQLPANGQQTVQYQVTNNTKITRTLTMKPLPGVTQISTGTGACSNPFTLAHGQTCLLTLQVNGSQMPERISGGPVVCKTQSPTNPAPDPFLCSQPLAGQQLNIRRISSEVAALSVTPTTLELQAESGIAGYITITNNSPTVTATNIQATLPANWTDVTQNATDCLSVQPHGTCQIQFIAGNSIYNVAQISIQGSNTTQSIITMAVVAPDQASISVSGSPLILNDPGPAGDLIVTNNSQYVTATNISANFNGTALDGFVTEITSTCASVPPEQQCTLTFQANQTDNSVPVTQFPISGSNTTEATGEIGILAIGDSFQGGMIACLGGSDELTFITTNVNVQSAQRWDPNDQTGEEVNGASSFSDGQLNTDAIVTLYAPPSSQSYAAASCVNYGTDEAGNPCTPGTPGCIYDDWFLPAPEQLQCLLTHKAILGIPDGVYWTSQQVTGMPNGAFQIDFTNATGPSGAPKANGNRVRCIRIFN